MSDKPYLSSSQMNMLWRCGEQYRRRYIEGERIPPGVAAVIGTGTHRSVEANLSHKMDTGELLTIEEVSAVARDGLDAAWDDGVALSEVERAKGEKKTKGEAIDQAVALSVLHHAELAPTIEPVGLEEKFVVGMNGYPFNLLGYIDIKEVAGIRDTKTAARAPGQDEADTSEQLTVYAKGFQATEGRLPEQLVLDYLVKTKTPKVVTYTTKRTEQDLSVLEARFGQACRIIEAEMFTPTSRSNWWCSEKWCGYFDTCPYAKGRVSITSLI